MAQMGVPILSLRVPLADDQLEGALLESYAQAAEVCFNRHYDSPAEITTESELCSVTTCRLEWDAITEKRRNSYNNKKDATEDGAYAVSIAILRQFCDHLTVKRAEQLSGSDFIVIPVGDEDFERARRLEVSGTEDDDSLELPRRLEAKLEQLARGLSDLPGIASVVSFSYAQVLQALTPE